MKRRLTAVTLSAMVGFGLAACGGDQEPARDTAPATPPPATQTTTPAPTTDATADPAMAGALPPGVTAQMVQQGRDVFHGQGICFTCHGQNGTGGALGPALNDQSWIHLTSGDMDEIRTVIRTGVSQPRQYAAPMPAMGGGQLNEDQLNAVTAYVYAISRGIGG